MTSPPSDREAPQGDWLAECVGYVVESGVGPIGRVADVERDPDSGRPVALVVRAGLAGWRRSVVPVGEVAGVVPSSERIILNGSAPPTAVPQPAPTPAG